MYCGKNDSEKQVATKFGQQIGLERSNLSTELHGLISQKRLTV